LALLRVVQKSFMPNIAAVLKSEISRVARKELRAAAEALRRSAAAQRAEVLALKRRVLELEKQLKAVTGARRSRATEDSRPRQVTQGAEEVGGLRFRAQGMASNRKRLALSAQEFGLLIGATAQSVYAWEQGKSKPQARNLAAIAALRGIGKREAASRLEALSEKRRR
jgi:DNA-binding transcriptional regulator YiaG